MTSITNQFNSIYSQLPSLSGSNFLNFVSKTSVQARDGLSALATQVHALATPIIERAGQFATANPAMLQYAGIAVVTTLTLVIALKILKAYNSSAAADGERAESRDGGDLASASEGEEGTPIDSTAGSFSSAPCSSSIEFTNPLRGQTDQ